MDNAAIDVERPKLWEAMGKLEQMVHIAKTLDEKLEDKAADLDATDPAKAKAIRETALFYVRQRTQDLLTQMAVSVQGYLALDLVKKNNVELVKGVDRASTTTVGALRTAVTVAQAMTNQRLVLQQITALNRPPPEIIDSTGKLLQATRPRKIHEQAASSSTIPIETLQRAFQNIYDTMDAVDTFKVKALDNMKQTVETLSTEVEKSKGYIARAEGQAQAPRRRQRALAADGWRADGGRSSPERQDPRRSAAHAATFQRSGGRRRQRADRSRLGRAAPAEPEDADQADRRLAAGDRRSRRWRWGIVIDGIGFTGIMVAFLAVVACTFLFSNFPKVRVPKRADLNTGDVRHMVARTELWLESQRPALPPPAVTLVDKIGTQLDALGLQLETVDPRPSGGAGNAQAGRRDAARDGRRLSPDPAAAAPRAARRGRAPTSRSSKASARSAPRSTTSPASSPPARSTTSRSAPATSITSTATPTSPPRRPHLMRVEIPHNLDKATTRARLRANSHKIADQFPGGMAQVETSWPNEDTHGDARARDGPGTQRPGRDRGRQDRVQHDPAAGAVVHRADGRRRDQAAGAQS